MICPFCKSPETKVTDKRASADQSTRRRRECLKCKKRFTTYERVENPNLIIIKKDQRREPFDKEKLAKGITKACQKRPVSTEKISKIVEEIHQKLLQQKTTEAPSKKVGELVMQKLKALDKVAYIRFASVYRDFKDITSFTEEIKKITKK